MGSVWLHPCDINGPACVCVWVRFTKWMKTTCRKVRVRERGWRESREREREQHRPLCKTNFTMAIRFNIFILSCAPSRAPHRFRCFDKFTNCHDLIERTCIFGYDVRYVLYSTNYVYYVRSFDGTRVSFKQPQRVICSVNWLVQTQIGPNGTQREAISLREEKTTNTQKTHTAFLVWCLCCLCSEIDVTIDDNAIAVRKRICLVTDRTATIQTANFDCDKLISVTISGIAAAAAMLSVSQHSINRTTHNNRKL